MKYKEWNFVDDKSKWGEGAWNNECDKVQWLDEETKLPCVALRHPALGHWCGYVGVSNSHPYYGHSWQEFEDLQVHGGVSFAKHCSLEENGVCHTVEPGEDDDVWWVGFDCAHYRDLSPGMFINISYLRDIASSRENLTYRDLNYVKKECSSLAKQLVEIQEQQ